jgi:hypothetical protein
LGKCLQFEKANNVRIPAHQNRIREFVSLGVRFDLALGIDRIDRQDLNRILGNGIVDLEQVRKLRTAFPSAPFPEMEDDDLLPEIFGRRQALFGISQRKGEFRYLGSDQRTLCFLPEKRSDKEKSVKKKYTYPGYCPFFQ